MPGDMAMVEEDGTMHFLGRGSICINSGGEKIYPEEVEGALKSHPAVHRRRRRGHPRRALGPEGGRGPAGPRGSPCPRRRARSRSTSSTRIARYKVPRFVTAVDLMQRSPSGKPDYEWATKVLADAAPHAA